MTKFVVKKNTKKSDTPFSIDTLYDRLLKEKAVDMRNNYRVVSLDGQYVKIVPIDEEKMFK